MITLNQWLINHLNEEPEIYEALRRDCLNLNAYSRQIIDSVQKDLYKQINHNSLVMALSRLSKKIQNQPSLIPKVKVDRIKIEPNIMVSTFWKNDEIHNKLKNFENLAQSSKNNFFTLVDNGSDLTLFCKEELGQMILSKIKEDPIRKTDNTVAISVKFDDKFEDIPNTLYAILRKLVVPKVNLIEIVSTTYELTLIVSKDDEKKCLDCLTT